jgi:hypothetical protein
MYVFYTVFSFIDVILSNIIMDKQYYYHTFTILLFRDIFIVLSLLNHLCSIVIFFLFAYSKYNYGCYI